MRKSFSLILLSLFIVSCSSTSDKDLFDKAMKDIETKKYVEAVQKFETILAESPNGEFSPQALFELAKLYHGYAIKTIPKEQSLQNAISFYSQLYKEHPNYKDSPASMMMTGFIYANDLNKIDTAKTIYENFLKKYPNSELVPSVKLELENLGLSPDEILSRKQQGTK